MPPSDPPTAPDGRIETPSAPHLYVARSGTGRPTVLAHGFTQDSRIWGGLDGQLSQDRLVMAVDLPGHGRSADTHADVVKGAALLGAVGGPGHYVGYSMGARHCLRLALDQPALVHRLVLISGTAGLDQETERAARRDADGQLADRLDPQDGSIPRDTLAEFLDRWMSQPLFGTVPEGTQGRAERLQGSATGLAASLRLAGTGSQEPLWGRLSELRVPVLLVVGSRDLRYRALADRMAAGIGALARIAVVEDADHAPHLQQPDHVTALVRSFLDEGDAPVGHDDVAAPGDVARHG